MILTNLLISFAKVVLFVETVFTASFANFKTSEIATGVLKSSKIALSKLFFISESVESTNELVKRRRE